MPRVELTDRFVSGSKVGDYFDAKTVGLNLRVTLNGVRSWFLLFTSPSDGKRARVTLGRYPQTSLARARTLAIEARGHLDEGLDPRVVYAAQGGAMTVGALIVSYLDKHVRPNLRSAAATERRLCKNVIPVIGGRPLAELHRREVNRVIDPILERGSPVEAARCCEDVRAMLRWAVARGDLDHNPMEGMRKPATSQPRERVLDDDEIRTLWNGLQDALPRSKACQRVVKLCLVTAQRVGEVSGMHPGEFDLAAGLWTIPGARSKNKHAHTVPLSSLAVEIIEQALADAGGTDFLFPNADGEPLPSHAVAKTIRLAQDRFGLDHWTLHDLRRTAVTGMAGLGIAPIVLGHVIIHRGVTRAGVTLSVYVQYDHAKEKREALDLWAERLAGIVGAGATVLPLKKVRG